MDFAKNSYYRETFSKLALTDKTIPNIEFEDCQFIDCSFLTCRFEKCSFLGCKFDGCIISASVVTDSRFVNVVFSNSKVIGINWAKTRRFQSISFVSTQINYSSFRQLPLPQIDITGCEAKEVDFTGADLTEGNLSNTDFEKSIFSKTNLTKANLKVAKNYYIDIRNNTVKKAVFSLPEALSLLSPLNIIIDSQ